MTSERWQRIERLYDAAVNLPKAERPAFLERESADDADLRREVDSLLNSTSESAAIDRGALEAAAHQLASHLSADLSGTALSRYKLVALLGAGGMGEVYRAYDTRLRREIALKILKADVLVGADHRRRLEREARSASALNHPNLVTLFDIDQSDGIDFITMEYIAGSTLAQAIDHRPLPLDRAVRYAVQIAGGLAAAHGTGIVHRDLKPGNIMITDTDQIKVLDFGLAKVVGQRPPGNSEDSLMTDSGKHPGMVLGTLAYMSPEQVQGQPIDARSDIFSFGVVLYEMLTGRRAFHRDSAPATMAAVLKDQPPVSSFPPALAQILSLCLQKDPSRRYQHMGDVHVALQNVAEQLHVPSNGQHSKQLKWSLAGTAALLVGIGTGAAWLITRGPPEANPVVTPFTSDPGYEGFPSFSPDGRSVAYLAKPPGPQRPDIYVKLIGGGRPLRLTSDPAEDLTPAWSPDGQMIAFLRLGAPARCVLVPALGGPERLLGSPFRSVARGLTWSRDGRWIIHTEFDHNDPNDQTASIYALSVADGEKRKLTTAPPGHLDISPALSRDGRALLFSRERNYWSEIFLLSLSPDLTPVGDPKQLRKLGRMNDNPVFTADGKEILFRHGSSAQKELWRMPLNGSAPPQPMKFAGHRITSFALSPAGDRLIFGEFLSDLDIWRLEVTGTDSPAPTRFITSTWADFNPSYSPDGSRIAFATERSGYTEIWISNSDGSDPVQLTSLQPQVTGPPRWSPDGSRIVFDANLSSQFDVCDINSSGGSPRRLTDHPADDAVASYSRDGRSIYFTSDRTGRFEVWKMPASGGPAVQVTRNGGWSAHESLDGQYLYHVDTRGANLRRLSLASGEETSVLKQVDPITLSLSRDGAYFARWFSPAKGARIEHFDFRTGRTRLVYISATMLVYFTSVSPDGRYLLYSTSDRPGTDLMLVENFR